MVGHWSCKYSSCIISIFVLLGPVRDILSTNCSDLEFQDMDSLQDAVQKESSRFSKVNQETRITGGEYYGSHRPYLVAICRKYNHSKDNLGFDHEDACGHSEGFGNVCAGVLVHEFYILTAASCIEDFKMSGMTVVAGPGTLPLFYKDLTEVRKVSFKVVHPDFKRRAKRIDNDLAILKVDQEIKPKNYGDDQIWKIPLAIGTTVERTGSIYGWGCTWFSKNECQYFNARALYAANMTIWSDDECNEMLLKLKKPMEIMDYHICAGGENDAGFCYGDPGSPLVVLQGSKKEILVGIASFLASVNCACDGIPTVYTEVSRYKDWIEEVLEGKYDISKASEFSKENINMWIFLTTSQLYLLVRNEQLW